jgi:hypothetical protein
MDSIVVDDDDDEVTEKSDTQKFKDYNNFSKTIIDLKNEGATDAELRSALLTAYQKGEIEKETYEDLKNNLLGGNNR